jgi:teichoic acid transport system permease protein
MDDKPTKDTADAAKDTAAAAQGSLDEVAARESDAHEAGVLGPDTPEADAPETDTPEADAPEADAPEADTSAADAVVPTVEPPSESSSGLPPLQINTATAGSGALAGLFRDSWQWRSQVGRLAIFDLMKRSRGTVLSWAWLFVRPLIYIFVFWFALDVGLRAGEGTEAAGLPPYFLWLCSGLIPWFFMQDMFSMGSDVYRRYPYLVTKLRFPLSAISTVFTLASFIIELGLIVLLFGIYFAYGMPLDIYLIQVPIVLVLMFLFWDCFSVLASQVSALSRDFANLLRALTTPLFWLSGVIFNMASIDIPVVQTIMDFNPVTFFVTAMRDALYYKVWFWNDPMFFWSFVACFVVQLVLMVLVYRRLSMRVADYV